MHNGFEASTLLKNVVDVLTSYPSGRDHSSISLMVKGFEAFREDGPAISGRGGMCT